MVLLLGRDKLARTLGALGPMPILAGVEHEWRLTRDGGPVDFRAILPSLAAHLRHRDPGDPRAVRLSCGVGLTADGWEAELVTPPLPLRAGTPQAVADLMARGERELNTRLSRLGGLTAGVEAEGFSTHLNVSVDDRHVVEAAARLARRCAPALALLLDRADSPGILLRPRRGRLEIGCDHVPTDQLEPAVVAVAGIVGLCSQDRHAHRGTGLPSVLELPQLDLLVEPARERFGHFVAGSTTGVSATRRWFTLRTRTGDLVRAGDHLRRVWDLARAHAVAAGLDPSAVDAMVEGRRPLPCEAGRPRVRPADHEHQVDPVDGRWPLPDLRARVRPFGRVEVAWATWSVTAWRCRSLLGDAECFVVIPEAARTRFVDLLDAGRLDHVLRSRLRRSGDPLVLRA